MVSLLQIVVFEPKLCHVKDFKTMRCHAAFAPLLSFLTQGMQLRYNHARLGALEKSVFNAQKQHRTLFLEFFNAQNQHRNLFLEFCLNCSC